jgi:hypothetical protein
VERRAVAVVGYSDDSDDSDDDDDDDSNASDDESGDSNSDSDSDSGAEEAKRAAKRRKATVANPPPSVAATSTRSGGGGGGGSTLGSVEELFATTAQSTALTRKEDDFEVGAWDAKQAEAKLRETLASATQKAQLDFINEGEKNSLTKGASSRLGRNGGVGNNSKPSCVQGSNFHDYH